MPRSNLHEPGARIGGYVVRELCGVGGTGLVYQVEDAEGRAFALKIPRFVPEDLTDGLREREALRLEREFGILHAVGPHPGIVRVHAFGRHQGAPFYVMDFLEGAAVDQLLRELRPAPTDLVELFREVCVTVAFLHRRGVCHRDLRPGNIMVRMNGGPCLIDVGVALPTTTSGTAHTSPEQRAALQRGDVEPSRFGPADDVYSLGVTLYQLLTGELPYPIPAQGEPPPRHPSELNPRVPGPLGDLAMRMISVDPSARPSSGDEVVAALDAALRVAPKEAPRRRLAPLSRKQLAGIMGLVLLVAGALLGATYVLRPSASRDESAAPRAGLLSAAPRDHALRISVPAPVACPSSDRAAAERHTRTARSRSGAAPRPPRPDPP